MFSVAQHEAVIAEINQGLNTINAKLDQVIPAADSVAGQWWVADVIGEALVYIARETVELGKEIVAYIADLLKGAVAPIIMFQDSWKWADIKSGFSGVATELSDTNLIIDDSKWSGDAKGAYVTVAAAQSTAAGRAGSIAGTTMGNLIQCALAGSVFYLAVATIVAKLIVAASAAVAAISTAVFSEIGAMIFVEEGTVNITALSVAAGVLATFLSSQAVAMVMLHSDATDPTSFPGGGHWPASNTARYDDATVNDADGHPDADWSLKGD